MTDSLLQPTFQYLDQLIKTKQPIVPILSYVKVKQNGTVIKEISIIYYKPEEQCLRRMYNNDFAVFMLENLLSFELGMSSQVLAGIVRPSNPGAVEPWRGDTIEKINYESFSLYRGLLSIIGKNDGLPLVVPQNKAVVGDIVPGVKKILKGKNPTVVRQKIKQLEALQTRIAGIVGNNPFETAPVIHETIESTFNQKYLDLSDKQIARMKRMRAMI